MATTTNYGWTTPDDTALVKDGASAIRTLGSSVDTTTKNLNPETTLGDLSFRSSTSNVNTRIGIGSSGQFLSVVGGVPAWATATDQTPLTTKGDIFTFSTVDARLAVGTDGQVLTADSNEATGLKFATPGGGGKVLQVVSSTLTSGGANVSSTTLADSGITATITPTSATSKVMVIISGSFFHERVGTDSFTKYKVLRGATDIGSNVTYFLAARGANATAGIGAAAMASFTTLDAPATTSATTYKMQIAVETSGSGAYIACSPGSSPSTITLFEIGA